MIRVHSNMQSRARLLAPPENPTPNNSNTASEIETGITHFPKKGIVNKEESIINTVNDAAIEKTDSVSLSFLIDIETIEKNTQNNIGNIIYMLN